MDQTRYARSTNDETALVGSLRSAVLSLQAEQFDSQKHGYLNDVIPKPWGYEFRVYADDFYDIWKLCLLPGQATSLHCHPRKETALLCLAGSGHLQLLDREQALAAGHVVFLSKGVFHGTENTGQNNLHLVEVEVPRNKLDLVRLRDRYGRQATQYETTRLAADALLRPGHFTPHSALRATIPGDAFRFGIRAGLDLVTRPDPDLLFAVSLDIGDALDHTITVHCASLAARVVAPEQLYLTISSPAPEHSASGEPTHKE